MRPRLMSRGKIVCDFNYTSSFSSFNAAAAHEPRKAASAVSRVQRRTGFNAAAAHEPRKVRRSKC